MNLFEKKVLVIVGPTAVGKTATSIQLAQKFNGEIISGDSMQVYRKLDIGTAKVTKKEAQGIPHHLVDCRNIHETYSAANFQKEARHHIEQISQKGKLPIIVGGTGLYIQSLIYDYDLGGNQHTVQQAEYRQSLQNYYDENGKELLWERLNQQDPTLAENTHPNNVKRVMRMLEIVENEGGSSVSKESERTLLYDVKFIGLTTERAILYDRINKRVELMMTEGLLEEARYVYQNQTSQAAQGIGYKEFFPYFAQQEDLNQAIEKVKQQSRRYAKRQLTWFRNRMNIDWYDLVEKASDMKKLEEDVEKWLDRKVELR